MSPGIAKATALMLPHMPDGTLLTIEENRCTFGQKYIYRLQYTSANSGRTMCILAKGDQLPTESNGLTLFYARQLVLDPKEVAVEFARIYWREKNARQQMFLSGELGNIRVADLMSARDRSLVDGQLGSF